MNSKRLIETCLVISAAFFLFTGLFYLRDFIVPILYGLVLAMLFVPLCRRLEKRGIHRGIAIGLCLLLFIVVVSAVGILLYFQLVDLSKDFPLFRDKAWRKFKELQLVVDHLFHVSAQDQNGWLKENYEKMLSFGTGIIASLFRMVSGGLELFLLMLLYLFLFLLLRTRIKEFVLKSLPKLAPDYVLTLLSKTETVTRSYVSGILKLMVVMGVLNTLGFFLCGVKQAIFWGMLRGILNAIPYVGPILGAIFPMVSTLIQTDDWMHPFGVLLVIVITQIIQDVYVLPFVVGSNIRLNALTTILSVFVGNMLWGIHGMVLLLPLTGIIKVLCDNVPSLKPIGYLLGDEKKFTDAK